MRAKLTSHKSIGGWPSTIKSDENLPCSSCRLNTDRIEARRNEEAFEFWCFAKQVAIVWRKTFGPVEEKLNTAIGKFRYALHRAFEQWLDVRKILRQLVKARGFWNVATAPRLRDRLKPADQQFSGVFLEVGATVRIA